MNFIVKRELDAQTRLTLCRLLLLLLLLLFLLLLLHATVSLMFTATDVEAK